MSDTRPGPGRPRKPADEIRRKRHISIEDPLWKNFTAKAGGEGKASGKIRELMQRFLNEDENETERAA